MEQKCLALKKIRLLLYLEQLDKREDEITMEFQVCCKILEQTVSDIFTELLYLLEEAFDDKIPENEASEFETVGDVVTFIEKRKD